ncbi:Protease Do-like 7 [Ancistrocladus abbreviatus]
MGDPVERLGSEGATGPESSIKEDLCVENDPPFRENVATAEDWRKALNKVIPAVVVLQTTACRAFDTESAGASNATGFVIDKLRGIILTNRHNVKPGPVVMEAVFLNSEVIPVYPIYRDPVHDFGFTRYDPGAVRFLSYEEIPLAPEAACVGLEIRVVGNDSGEKVSVLAGTLARLDRDAPHYKAYAASGTRDGSSGSPVIDWQGRAVALNAGANLSSASAYFLPLERVVRALRFLQEGRDPSPNQWPVVTIPRGTLQVTFIHEGFDEIRQLGPKRDAEMMVRCASPPAQAGMLIVDSVVPGGPAHERLEPGDVLVSVNGEVISQFLKLENLLDDNVSQRVELQIKSGGSSITVDLVVQDLHSITPDNFLEVSGAVIHPLSYQQARNFHFNCGLVYVAEPGYMLFRAGVPRHAIIKKFAGEEISRLADLISVLSKLSKGVRVPLEYITYMDRHRRKSVLVTVDRHEWYAPPRVYTRDDSTGLWIARLALPSNSPLLSSVINYAGGTDPETMLPGNDEVSLVEYADQQNSHKLVDGAASMEAHYNHVFEEAHSRDGSLHEPREENLDHSTISETAVVREYQAAIIPGANTSVAESVIEPTLVLVEVHVPPSCMLDGVHSQHFLGTGVIIHHSQNMGLVAVDRNTVAISASDVMLSFAAFPIEIPGEVVFLHPVHNYAVVAYDPSALGSGASVVRAAELLPEPTLHRGDTVYLVGLSRSLRATSRKSIVTNPCDALDIVSADCPRYRAINMEVIELDTDFGSTFSGVLTDDQGRVQAVWGSFSGQLKHSNHSSDHRFVRGIPIYTISQVLDKILSGAKGPALLINGVKRPMPLVRILEVELYATPLSKAQSFGLTDDWVQALVKKDPLRRQVLHVKGCFAGSKAEHVLEHGDMILAINKEPVTCFSDVENACQELDKNGESDGRLHMTILRQGHEIEVFVGTDVRDGNGTVRVINWCGCIVQDPHPAVRALGFLPEEGHCVYVASIYLGSPVHRGGLYAFQWIVEVNGKSTHDLDAFVKVTKKLQDGEVACVRTINLKGKPRMLNVKQDLHYWPTWELRFDPDTAKWRRTIIKALHPDVS